MEANPESEARPTGVWFNDENVWMQRKPCVVQWTKQTPEHVTEPMEVFGCPGCMIKHMRDMHPGRKVKRWLLLPA